MNRYAIPLFLMLLAGTIYVLYIDASIKNIKQQLAKEEEINGYLELAKEARGKLDEIELQYKNFPPDANKKLSIILPESIDSLKLIIDVNTVAKRHGLQVLGPAVTGADGDAQKSGGYAKYKLNFKVSATYPAFQEFLGDIQKSLALRDFNNVAFTATTEKDAAGNVSKPENAIYDYQVELMSYALN